MKRFLPTHKRFFAFLLALGLGMGTAFAYDFSATYSGKTFYFNITNSANRYVEITYPGSSDAPWSGFTRPTGDITLPSSVTYNDVTYSVKRIGDYAFGDCIGLTGSLTIPSSVTTIGDNAFSFCRGFTGSLTIGNNVTTIGDYAFYYCDGFTGSLTLPNSVTTIDDDAFNMCFGLTGVNYTGTMAQWCNISFESYGSNPLSCAHNLYIDGSLVTNLVLPSSLTAIKDYTFCGGTCFTGTLTLLNSVTSIGNRAFYDCTGLTGVNYTGTMAQWCNISFGGFCSNPLYYAHNLYINGSLVTNLVIPENLTTIKDYTFTGGTCFTGTLTIPNTVTTIGDSAFEYCTGFTGSLTIPSSVTSIGEGAFCNCTGFTGTLTIPNSVTLIADYAFSSCNGFTGTLSIPDFVTSIGHYAFDNCTGFTGSLTIPNSVTWIGSYAFHGCTGFNGSLTIGNSVTLIWDYAFSYCRNLSSITVLPETPPTTYSHIFANLPRTIPIYVPCSAMDDYQAAMGWSAFNNYQCNPVVTVMVVPTEGGTVTGGGTYTNGATCTVTATPNPGYQFMHWSKDGTVVSTDSSCWFFVTEDTELEAVFMRNVGVVIGEGENKSEYLPSYSYYNYSLTEQIYTFSEVGGSRLIYTISFFNAGHTETRDYDIYMKKTPKTSFSSTTDWVSVSSDYLVFSGTVTMKSSQWTTIVLDRPYNFNSNGYSLLIAVDDNTGDYTDAPHMSCRTYAGSGNQALSVYSDGINYNPNSPSSYSGTLMAVKNQIVLNRAVYDITATSANTSAGTVSGGGTFGYGDLCSLAATANSGYTFLDWINILGETVSTDANYSFIVTDARTLTARFISASNICHLTFDLHDSYGNGWNGNELVVNYPNGMTEKLTVPYGEHDATFTLPIPDGSHVELSWIEGNNVDQCSFEVRYSDGSLVYVGRNLDESFEYEFDMDCAGQSEGWAYIGGHSTANNSYLPSWSYFSYGLSEQIYTADEIGTAGLINGIAFYNRGTETKTRTYAIYLKRTDKTAFESPTDWIGASDAQMVYNGEVTMTSGTWTPIVFTYPFEYDGVSNLVLIVDDNTADYTGLPFMSCLVYPTNDFQTLRICSDGTNYDPNNPFGYTGTLQNVKNQIQMDITPACLAPFDLEATDITSTSANINWNLANDSFELQYREMCPNNDFGNGFGLWTTIDADGDGYDWFYSHAVGYGESVGMAESESWHGGTVLTPDNYLVSPQITLGGSISFWARAEDEYFAAEHFGVAVSTTGNTNAADFTTIQEWTITAKGDGVRDGHTREDGTRGYGTWYQYTVNLSAYSGHGYVAIRHFNCTDMFRLDVDDITIVQPGVNSSWTTVSDVTNPYTLTGLTPGTRYEVRVRSNCGGDQYSGWAYTAFTTGELATVTQTVALTAGINWFSTNVESTINDLKTALLTASPNTSITIKGKSGSIKYIVRTHSWNGTLDWDMTQMYKIQVQNACEITLEGTPINPAEHPVTISPNTANWIGYPLAEGMTVTAAFADFGVVTGDVVKSKSGSTRYRNGSWRPNGLTTLELGQGYIYNSAAMGERTLVFPSSAK